MEIISNSSRVSCLASEEAYAQHGYVIIDKRSDSVPSNDCDSRVSQRGDKNDGTWSRKVAYALESFAQDPCCMHAEIHNAMLARWDGTTYFIILSHMHHRRPQLLMVHEVKPKKETIQISKAYFSNRIVM